MIPYRNELTFERSLRIAPSIERTVLRVYTGRNISELEARDLWKGISDHKWYVSEALHRDVGFHVAAVDYIENVCDQAESNPERSSLSGWKRLSQKVRALARNYFEAHGSAMPS